MSHRISATAGLRALTASALTGALAVAAHGWAGGGWPVGGAGVLLAATAAVVGLSALSERAAATPMLAVLLAGGQLGGHLALAVAGHSHASPLPGPLMLSMHLVAVAVGAVLMSACERLCQVLSQVARRCVRISRVPVGTRTALPVTGDGQPLQHVLLLAASISHRGPPACVRL